MTEIKIKLSARDYPRFFSSFRKSLKTLPYEFRFYANFVFAFYKGLLLVTLTLHPGESFEFTPSKGLAVYLKPFLSKPAFRFEIPYSVCKLNVCEISQRSFDKE